LGVGENGAVLGQVLVRAASLARTALKIGVGGTVLGNVLGGSALSRAVCANGVRLGSAVLGQELLVGASRAGSTHCVG